MSCPSSVKPIATLGIDRIHHSPTSFGNIGTEYRTDMKRESWHVPKKRAWNNQVEKTLFEQGISPQDRRATGEQKKGLEKFSKPLTTWYARRDSNPRPSDSKSDALSS